MFLESPVLSNSQFEKFLDFFKKSTKILDCTFNTEESLKQRLDELRSEAEIAVREGVKHLVLSDKGISEKRHSIPMALSNWGNKFKTCTNLGDKRFCFD